MKFFIEKKGVGQNEICIELEVGYLSDFVAFCLAGNTTQLVLGWAWGERMSYDTASLTWMFAIRTGLLQKSV